ncbi:MAG: TIGR03943 family protein [Methylacidiphilales bacterium]|nr:TIGR03943 family protein [Candidatus Methylacidiphilales bacterium]
MIARQISFFAPAAVMSAWATVMLHTIASGHANRLLIPLLRNFVLTAAILLLVLSALYLLLYQPDPETAPVLAPRGRLRQLGRWLVLLLPVVAASILSPSALSSTTAGLRGLDSTAGVPAMPSWNAESQENAKKALEADPNQPVPIEVTDLITLSQSPAQIKAFDGRKVRTVGLFVAKPGSAPKLVRWIMWCCAADAIPASVELGGNPSGTWSDTQYLEVVGTAHFPSTLGHVVPRIDVESITPTQEPDEPYLSP